MAGAGAGPCPPRGARPAMAATLCSLGWRRPQLPPHSQSSSGAGSFLQYTKMSAPGTLKLQFRGALYLSGDKALPLRLPPELCRWLGHCWYGVWGCGEGESSSANGAVVEAACEINGNGSTPPQGASGKRAGSSQPLLPAPCHDLQYGRRGEEKRGWGGPASASAPRPDPQL